MILPLDNETRFLKLTFSDRELDVKLANNNILYGGNFDIASGPGLPLDLSPLKASLLFYDAVAVPDGFFMCRGAFSTQLLREIRTRDQENVFGPLLMLLRSGLIVPKLRTGNHISEVWRSGEEFGVLPGQLQYLSKEVGDELFEGLSKEEAINSSTWPDGMGTETSSSFAEYLKEILLDEESGIPTPEGLEQVLTGFGGSNRSDINAMTGMFDALHLELENNLGNARYRRGDIEAFFARQLGWNEFSYDRLWGPIGLPSGQGSFPTLVRSLMRSITTIYQIHQATHFGTSLHLLEDHDPVINIDRLSEGAVRQGRLSTYSIDLLPQVNFSKFDIDDLLSLRRTLRKSGNSILEENKKHRKRLQEDASRDNLFSFRTYLEGEFLSLLMIKAPQAISDPVANLTQRVSRSIGDKAYISSLIALTVANVGIIRAPFELDTVDIAIAAGGAFGHSRVQNTVVESSRWIDRTIFHGPKLNAALKSLRSDFAIGK